MAGKLGGQGGAQVPQAKTLQSLLGSIGNIGYGGGGAGMPAAPTGLLGYNPFTKPSYTPPAPQGFPGGLLRPYFPTGFVNPAQPKPKPPTTGKPPVVAPENPNRPGGGGGGGRGRG